MNTYIVTVLKSGSAFRVNAINDNHARILIREKYNLDGRLTLTSRPLRNYEFKEVQQQKTMQTYEIRIKRDDLTVTVSAFNIDQARHLARRKAGVQDSAHTVVTKIY